MHWILNRTLKVLCVDLFSERQEITASVHPGNHWEDFFKSLWERVFLQRTTSILEARVIPSQNTFPSFCLPGKSTQALTTWVSRARPTRRPRRASRDTVSAASEMRDAKRESTLDKSNVLFFNTRFPPPKQHQTVGSRASFQRLETGPKHIILAFSDGHSCL